MNVELLLKIKAHILEEPLRIYMDTWAVRGRQFEAMRLQEPKCHTTGCISGWAAFLMGEFDVVDRYDILDIDRLLASKLFHSINWPMEFQIRLQAAMVQTTDYAQVVADYIDYFIKEYAPQAA